MVSATTAIPRGVETTSTTPFTAFALAPSNDFSVAPNSGGWIITAVSIPGSFTSIVNCSRPVDFSRLSIRGRFGIADELPVLRVLQGHLARNRHGGSGADNLTKARAPAGSTMREHALLDGDLGLRHLPGARCRRNQHLARRGAGLAVAVERGRDGGRTAGALHGTAPHEIPIEFRVAPGAISAHLRPIRLEFFRHERREPVIRTLAHVHVGGMHDHQPLGRDGQISREGVDLGVRKGRLRLHGAVRGLGHPEPHRKPATDGGGPRRKRRRERAPALEVSV